MPLYDYKCMECGEVEEVLIEINEINVERLCKRCNGIMKKLITKNFHIKCGVVFDGRSRGKVIKEKNETLKKKYAGYAYEHQSLRDKVTKEVQKKLRNKNAS